MKKEDISFLVQVLNSMKDSFDKMKKSYESGNSSEMQKYKGAFIELGKEFEEKLNEQ